MESKVHSAKQKSGHHFIYLDDYNIQRRMNKQSGFNAERIEKDKYLESKNRLKIKSNKPIGASPSKWKIFMSIFVLDDVQ